LELVWIDAFSLPFRSPVRRDGSLKCIGFWVPSLLWKLEKIDHPLTITTAFGSALDRLPIGGV
jgi:hypothetical protein